MSVPWYLMAKGKGGGGYKTASGPIVSISDALAAPLRSLVANIEPVQSGSGDPSPDNVRPISGWSEVNVWVKPTYDPTANPTATLQLGQTVYGGTLDVTNGVLTVDRASVDMGTLAWIMNPQWWTSQTNDLFQAQIADGKPSSPVMCDIYSARNGGLDSRRYANFEVPKGAYNSADEFKTAMTGHQLVYELTTPITISLTPQEISTLAGQNNVWADSGDVTVEYLSSGGANADLMKLAVAFMGRK